MASTSQEQRGTVPDMQISQVPTWAGSTVGALVTLLGVVVAQWHTGKRERDRLAHDKEIDLAKLRADHQASWRDMKVKTYGQFLTKLRTAESMLGEMRHVGDFEGSYLEFRAHMESFDEADSEIEPISSASVERFMHYNGNVARIAQLSRLTNRDGNLSNFAQTGDAKHPAVKRLTKLYKEASEYPARFLADCPGRTWSNGAVSIETR